MLEAEQASRVMILYAENWIYAPSIHKEREIVEKTGAQILWMIGEESHSGSHSDAYGKWALSGGGVMLAKGCHPLTRSPHFRDEGFIRTGYEDIDDLSMMHVVFYDGTVADIFASDIVLGGIHNELEVVANNHRTICRINPSDAMQSYNPRASQFDGIYVVEKIGTKEGWSNPAPDEDWATGYPQEIDAFYRNALAGEAPECGSGLGADAMLTIYSAYVSADRGGAETGIELIDV